MKPMIWHPEEKDRQVNEYLEKINRAPYVTIFAILLLVLCVFTGLILVGAF